MKARKNTDDLAAQELTDATGAEQAEAPKKGKKARKAKGKKARAQKKKRKRKGPSISNLIALTIMLVGAIIVAYPTFSDWWNSFHQSRAIANYVNAVEETDPELIEHMFEEAHAYNERLLSKPNRYVMSDEERAEYESILDLTGSGVIGYIQINNIGVNLPIYHGVAESVLQVAIGHIEGSSLPVGGPSTHAVVSGHRGLPSAKLFTDLDKLVEGDTFTITVLDQTITYEVDQIRIVEPSDMSDLNIVREADYVTLVTCTPYGINTHRLLVRGHRIDNIAGTLAVPAEAVQIPNYVAVPAVGLPMLFIYLIGALIYYRGQGRYDKQKALDEIRSKYGKQLAARDEAEAAAAAETPAEQAAAKVEAEVAPEQAVTEAQAEPEPAAEPEPDPASEPEATPEPPAAEPAASEEGAGE